MRRKHGTQKNKKNLILESLGLKRPKANKDRLLFFFLTKRSLNTTTKDETLGGKESC